MGFKIEITETNTFRSVTRDYRKIADTGNERDNGPVYAHIDDPQGIITKTRQVLTQEVETLDLGAVIKAINNL